MAEASFEGLFRGYKIGYIGKQKQTIDRESEYRGPSNHCSDGTQRLCGPIDPLEFYIVKNIDKEVPNRKVIESRSPKSRHYDSKYNFSIFKINKLY